MSQGIDKAKGAVSGLGEGISGMFSGGALGLITGGVSTLLGSLYSLVSGAITGQMDTLAAKFKQVAVSVAETARNARRLGTTTETLMGIEYAAARSGIGVEQLNKALFHMQRHKGGDVMTNLMAAADRFEAGGINQAAFAFENFAKNGFAMMEMLGKGSQGIKDMMERGRQLGVVLSDVDSARIVMANKALKDISFAVEGIYNKMVVAMAPAVDTVATKLMELAPVAGKIGDVLSEAFGVTLQAAAGVFSILLDQAINIGKEFLKGFTGLSGEIDYTGVLIAGLKDGLKLLAKAFAYVWDTAKMGAGIFEKQLGKMTQTMGSFAKKVGLSDLGDMLTRWGKGRESAGQAMIDSFGQTVGQIDAAWDKMFDKQQVTQHQVAEAAMAEYRAVGAMFAGGKEAYSVEARFATQRMMNPLDETRKQTDLMKQQIDVQKQQLGKQGEIFKQLIDLNKLMPKGQL